MLEWPEGAGLFSLFAGLLGFLAYRSLLSQRVRWLDWWYVSAVLVIVLSCFVWISLGEGRGRSGGGLFQYDGFSLFIAIALLIFGVLVHFIHFFDRKVAKPETAGLEIAVLFLGITLILANHLVLYVLAVPLLLLITFFAPRLSQRGQSNESLFVGIGWALAVLVLLSLSTGLWYEATGSLELSRAKDLIIQHGANPSFVIAWCGFATVFLVLVLLAPFGIFFQDYKKAESWALVGGFRLTTLLLANILFVRWILIIGEHSFVGASDLSSLVAVSVSLSVLLLSILSRDLLQILQALSLQPFLMILWAIARGPAVKEYPDLYLGLACLITFFVGVPRLLFLFRVLKLNVSAQVGDLGSALRGASFFTRFEVFTFIFVLSPFGTFLGINLLTKKSTGPHQWIEAICAASLMISLTLVLSKVFGLQPGTEPKREKLPLVSLVIGFACVLTVIVLGIYPTPLYNYINYLLNPS